MNRYHRRLCRSDAWAEKVRTQLLPAVLDGLEPGPEVLELGPGPGRTTEQLLAWAPRLTALEVERPAARALRARLPDPRLRVVAGDATAMPFASGAFDAVLCLTMLHHLPDAAAQDRLLAESARVLRPGGVLAGSDGLRTPRFRLIHLFDVLVAVDPDALPDRLRRAGLVDPVVTTRGDRLRFRARRPG